MHKETRYAIPSIPFWALAAAPTLRSWIARGEARAPGPWRVRLGALGIVLLVGAAVAYDAGKYRFVRSEAAVRLGWAVGAIGRDRDCAEQLWRFGGHLYLDASAPLIDLDLEGPDGGEPAARRGVPAGRAVGGPETSPVHGRDDRRAERCGLAADVTDTDAGYVLFRKRS